MAAGSKEASMRAMWGDTIYNDYIIHTTTKNTSFIKMYSHLKKKGIRNNKFFLRLYDQDLLRVDPFSKTLTPAQKSKILVEIAKNPYYFIREIVRIPIPGGLQSFEVHRGNLALTWAILNNLNLIVLLPRQRYKTISIICALIWVFYFGTDNTHMLFSNKELRDSKNNLKRFKDITGHFPQFIKDAILNNKDINNIENIWSKDRNNTIDTSGSPISPESADKQGRGMSIPVFWSDEFAFLKYNDIMYKAAAPAISKVSEIAERDGRPHTKIISTTPKEYWARIWKHIPYNLSNCWKILLKDNQQRSFIYNSNQT